MKNLKFLLVAAFVASTILNLLLLSSPVYNGAYKSQEKDPYGDDHEIIFNENVATYDTINICSVKHEGRAISVYYRDWYIPKLRMQIDFDRKSVFELERDSISYICEEAIITHTVYSIVMISTACAFTFVLIRSRRNKNEKID